MQTTTPILRPLIAFFTRQRRLGTTAAGGLGTRIQAVWARAGGLGLYSDASQTPPPPGASASYPIGYSAATDNDALTGIGVILNDGLTNNIFGNDTGYTSFDGMVVSSDTVLVKFTYYGDTQFNGSVSQQDVVNASTGRDFGGSGWANGETQYQGFVNQQDVVNVSTGRDFYSTDPIVFGSSPSVAIAGGGAIGVPEPSAGLISLIAAASLAGCVVFRRRSGLVGQKAVA